MAPGVSATTIHGWQSGRLVRSGGVLYASAARSNPAAKHFWDHEGDLFRREADGGWIEAATLPFNPYTMAVGPDGTFWPRFIRQARWRGPGVGLLGAS